MSVKKHFFAKAGILTLVFSLFLGGSYVLAATTVSTNISTDGTLSVTGTSTLTGVVTTANGITNTGNVTTSLALVTPAITAGSGNTALTVNAAGSGTIGIGSASTGAVTITPSTTIAGILTTSNGITNTGNVTTSLALVTPAITAGSGNTAINLDGAGSGAVTIGKTSTGPIILGRATTVSSTLTLAGGTGVAHIVSTQGTAPTVTSTNGWTNGSLTGTDVKGRVSSTPDGSSAGQITVNFNSAYAAAPICVIIPADTGTVLDATSTYVTSSVNSFSINYRGVPSAIAKNWNYHCIE